jgi:hypothetical protein
MGERGKVALELEVAQDDRPGTVSASAIVHEGELE